MSLNTVHAYIPVTHGPTVKKLANTAILLSGILDPSSRENIKSAHETYFVLVALNENIPALGTFDIAPNQDVDFFFLRADDLENCQDFMTLDRTITLYGL